MSYENDCSNGVTITNYDYYRPHDYVPPSTVKGQCTHTTANGRNVPNQNKCSGFATDVATCDADTDCTFIPLDMTLIKADYKCEEGVEKRISIDTSTTQPECHIKCLLEPLCTWVTYDSLTNECTLSSADCPGANTDAADGISSYRPSDYTSPSVAVDTCTHIEEASRTQSKRDTCSAIVSEAACTAISDCFFTPGDPVLLGAD